MSLQQWAAAHADVLARVRAAADGPADRLARAGADLRALPEPPDAPTQVRLERATTALDRLAVAGGGGDAEVAAMAAQHHLRYLLDALPA